MTAQDTLSALQAAIKADPADTVSRLALADLYESEGKESLALEQRTLANLTVEDRSKALVSYLKSFLDTVDEDDFFYDERNGEFTAEGADYLVLTDEEADQAAKEDILSSVWAFNPSFLSDHIAGDDKRAIEQSIKAVQDKCSEDANDLLRAALTDEDDFAEEAISADGRGHFLSSYDGEENEVTYNGATLYIYRVN